MKRKWKLKMKDENRNDYYDNENDIFIVFAKFWKEFEKKK